MNPDCHLKYIVEDFKSRIVPNHRYSSFDYCYNYFFTTSDLTKDMEKSCLVLGFYLASWGMFRGSSFLLQHSGSIFKDTIEYINTVDKGYWEIDVDTYNKQNIDRILNIYKEIKGILIPKGITDLTLVTKVLLGVFGFVPAFDNYFCKTFRSLFKKQCGFRRFNKNSLECIYQFYLDNKLSIDDLSDTTLTTDFLSGKKTRIRYPKAKIIDMYGFNKAITAR